MLAAVLGLFFGVMILAGILGFTLAGPSQDTLDKLLTKKKQNTPTRENTEALPPKKTEKIRKPNKIAKRSKFSESEGYLKALKAFEVGDALTLEFNKRLEDEFLSKLAQDQFVSPNEAMTWRTQIEKDIRPNVQANISTAENVQQTAVAVLNQTQKALADLGKEDNSESKQLHEQAAEMKTIKTLFAATKRKFQAWEMYFKTVEGFIDETGKVNVGHWDALNASRRELRLSMEVWGKVSPRKLKADQLALAQFATLNPSKKAEPPTPPAKKEPKDSSPKKPSMTTEPPEERTWVVFRGQMGQFSVRVPAKLAPDTGNEMPLVRKHEDPATNTKYLIRYYKLPEKLTNKKVPDELLGALTQAFTKDKNTQVTKVTRDGLPGLQVRQVVSNVTKDTIFYLVGKDHVLRLSAEYPKGADNQDAMMFIDSVRLNAKPLPSKNTKATRITVTLRLADKAKQPVLFFYPTDQQDYVYGANGEKILEARLINTTSLAADVLRPLGTSVIGFSPGGDVYATRKERTITVMDFQANKKYRNVIQMKEATVAFSKDEKYLVVGEKVGELADGQKTPLLVFDLSAGGTKTLKGHDEPIREIVFDEEGSLVSLSRDKVIRWEPKTWKILHQIKVTPEKDATAAWGGLIRKGKYYYVSTSDGFRLYATKTGELYHHFTRPKMPDQPPGGRISLSHDNRFIVGCGANDKTIYIWSVRHKQFILKQSKPDSAPIRDVIFTKNSTRIISATEDGMIYAWDFKAKMGESR
ncbi:MAG: WD40 repeat domain-containing protein [Gemmataceae bacterium]